MSNNTSNLRFDIAPFAGAGPLRFGMRHSEVRSLLGDKFSVHKKGPDAFDAYSELDLHLYYDAEGQLEFIEGFGSCPIYYQDVSSLRRDAQDVLKALAQLGLTSRHENQLYMFDDGGFALYVPDDIVLAVSVFRRGYYDEPPTVPGQ